MSGADEVRAAGEASGGRLVALIECRSAKEAVRLVEAVKQESHASAVATLAASMDVVSSASLAMYGQVRDQVLPQLTELRKGWLASGSQKAVGSRESVELVGSAVDELVVSLAQMVNEPDPSRRFQMEPPEFAHMMIAVELVMGALVAAVRPEAVAEVIDALAPEASEAARIFARETVRRLSGATK